MTETIGLVGNLLADPELRFSRSGNPWMRARFAVKPYAPGAEVQPEPLYFDLVAFGSLAENVAESCRQGDRVVVSGRVEQDTWTGRDGVERVTQKLIADAIGPDLRFTTATIARTVRTEPASTPAAQGYTEAPF